MCFPGVEIKGGVSYFLWDRDNEGACSVSTHYPDNSVLNSERELLEKDMNIFIRDSRQIEILHKVQAKEEKLFGCIMSANDPFGYDVRVENSYVRVRPTYELEPFNGACEFYYFGWRDKGVGYTKRDTVRKGEEYIDKYKVFVPRAWGVGNVNKDKVNPFIGKPNSVCTETYSAIGPFDTLEEAENVMSYINTKFFHFLVSIVKITQAAAKHVYKLVPMQDFSKPWTDTELYEKYGFTKEEISLIETSVWADINAGGDING
jgi:site-specific DNA-methyltransferase (adenine-specific)